MHSRVILDSNSAILRFSVSATYSTGKSMNQWVHTEYHFNENDKIDEVTQFLDRGPNNGGLGRWEKIGQIDSGGVLSWYYVIMKL